MGYEKTLKLIYDSSLNFEEEYLNLIRRDAIPFDLQIQAYAVVALRFFLGTATQSEINYKMRDTINYLGENYLRRINLTKPFKKPSADTQQPIRALMVFESLEHSHAVITRCLIGSLTECGVAISICRIGIASIYTTDAQRLRGSELLKINRQHSPAKKHLVITGLSDGTKTFEIADFASVLTPLEKAEKILSFAEDISPDIIFFAGSCFPINAALMRIAPVCCVPTVQKFPLGRCNYCILSPTSQFLFDEAAKNGSKAFNNSWDFKGGRIRKIPRRHLKLPEDRCISVFCSLRIDFDVPAEFLNQFLTKTKECVLLLGTLEEKDVYYKKILSEHIGRVYHIPASSRYASIIKSCDIFVVAPQTLGCGKIAYTALETGLPCTALKNGDSYQIFCDELCCKDTEELIDTVARCERDLAFRKKCAVKTKKHLRETLKNTIADPIKTIIDEIKKI